MDNFSEHMADVREVFEALVAKGDYKEILSLLERDVFAHGKGITSNGLHKIIVCEFITGNIEKGLNLINQELLRIEHNNSKYPAEQKIKFIQDNFDILGDQKFLWIASDFHDLGLRARSRDDKIKFYEFALSYCNEYNKSPKCSEAFYTIHSIYHDLGNELMIQENIKNALSAVNTKGVHQKTKDDINAFIIHRLIEQGDIDTVKLIVDENYLIEFEGPVWKTETLVTALPKAFAEINKTKIKEQERIIQNLCHSIKNIVRSAINPLEYAKQEINLSNNEISTNVIGSIENAERGMHLIKEMTSAATLSYDGKEKDFYDDAVSYNTDISLYDIILESIKTSISNIMFSRRYYKSCFSKYFTDGQTYKQCEDEFSKLFKHNIQNNTNNIVEFARKFFFEMIINIDDSKCLYLKTDTDNNAAEIKFYTIINEMILNAVKYSCTVDRAERRLAIDVTSDENNIILNVTNSYSTNVVIKSTGLGNVIMNNISKVMGGNIDRCIDPIGKKYSVALNFPNYWRRRNE